MTNLSLLISNFVHLILLSFFLMSLAKGLSILFIFSKSQLLVLLIFTIVSFISFPLISALIFMISFLLLIFFCSFASCFRYKIRLSIRCFSCFLRQQDIAINFPVRTAFAASHRVWAVVFSLSFLSRKFFLFPPFYFFSNLLVI